MNNETKQKLLKNLGCLGIAAVVFYFLHIIVGNILYAGYSPITQAVSDLTANGAPSEIAARTLSGIYGVFVVTFSLAFYIFFRGKLNPIFSLGALLFLIMQISSAVGYTAFPLSGAGYKGSFQDVMHIVTTVVVVVLGILALILLAIGFIKNKEHKILGLLAIATLFLMMTGAILSGAVPEIFGIAERITLYSLHAYIVILAVFLLGYKN
jgi:hypothetical membrane protein